MNANVLAAVFKRNLISYFSNPTGYVFICVFVLLSSLAAFFPHEFFNANLASLDQLNQFLPYIMLIFIPAITMSVWSEERRQGTDELLLTIPAHDLDVVLGKYLAAVAIFGVSLLFSLVCNYLVLVSLGDPDFLLFLSTYFGYFALGTAMLAIGMVASFLTGNVTIAFVLGALFNAPLAIFQLVDTFIPRGDLALAIQSWSLSSQFSDFGRGVISTSSLAYFGLIIVVMIYVSMVLIGRRHWLGGRDGHGLLGHYLARAASLAVASVAVVVFFNNFDVIRFDMTADGLNSMLPQTVRIIKDVRSEPMQELEQERRRIEEARAKLAEKEDETSKNELQQLDAQSKDLDRRETQLEQPIVVEAFISPQVPANYVQTRLNLLAMLNELEKRGGDEIQVKIYDAEPYTDLAKRARQQYAIEPRDVSSEVRGVGQVVQVFLGVAMQRGTEKPVVVPFFDLGMPVEYELARSISTVAHVKRKKLGIVTTDAQLVSRNEPIVDELRKQFEVVEVDPGSPIVDRGDPDKSYDVLMVVQPSSLTPQQLPNVTEAIRQGVPTAVFEDPAPVAMPGPGTDQPRVQSQQEQMMRMMQRMPPPPEKCNITDLFELLGIRMVRVLKPEADEPGEDQQSGVKSTRDALALFDRLDKDHGGTLSEDEFVEKRVGIDREIARNRFRKLDRPSGFGASDQQLSLEEFAETAIVWQRFNPYVKLKRFVGVTNEWLFLRPDAPGAEKAFNPDDPLSKGMREVSLIYAGAVEPIEAAELTFTPLVSTGVETGVLRFRDLPRGASLEEVYNTQANELATQGTKYTLAARIHGKLRGFTKSDDAQQEPDKDSGDDKESSRQQPGKVNVVFVTDVDLMAEFIVDLRIHPREDIELYWQNVPFVLNVLDDLAGDDRFIEIRKRELEHRTLTKVQEHVNDAVAETERVRESYIKAQKDAERKIDEELAHAKAEFDKKMQEAQESGTLTEKSAVEAITRLGGIFEDKKRERRLMIERHRNERNEKIKQIESELKSNLHTIQDGYKWKAILLPPIPPLMLALLVFINRRRREKEGVSKERLH